MKGIVLLSNISLNKRKTKIFGFIHFTETPKGLKIEGQVRNLKPGFHGIHIHSKGNLVEGGHSLCSHFNPYNKNHGDRNDPNSHLGDLGNIFADKNGKCDFSFIDKRLKLSGKNSIIGRSIVIHANKDDLGLGGFPDSLTTGHSGKRVCYGIIGYN